LRQGKTDEVRENRGTDSLFATYRLDGHFGKIAVEYLAAGVKYFCLRFPESHPGNIHPRRAGGKTGIETPRLFRLCFAGR
jgi:hypothetical protein